MEKELYYTNNKLISKLNIYFDLSPSQFNDINDIFFIIVIIKSKNLSYAYKVADGEFIAMDPLYNFK